MEEGPVPCGSLLETLGTRVSAGSSKKAKMGKVKKKCAACRLVLIGEDNVVRNRWPLGRVVEVFTGQDGQVVRSNPNP